MESFSKSIGGSMMEIIENTSKMILYHSSGILKFSTILAFARSLDIYAIVQALAFAIGFFFGGAVNLAESHFFTLLGKDPYESYTSALYGFTLSLVGAITMFLSGAILHASTNAYLYISVFLGSLALLALYGGWKGIGIVK